MPIYHRRVRIYQHTYPSCPLRSWVPPGMHSSLLDNHGTRLVYQLLGTIFEHVDQFPTYWRQT